MKRVVITGMGCITANGTSSTALWESLKAGKHHFSPLEDAQNTGVGFAAILPDFDPQEFGISKKDARRMDRYTQFALAATNRAMEMAGAPQTADPYRAGVIVGSGIGGLDTINEQEAKFMEKGSSRVSVFLIPMMISNIAAGMIAMEHGYKGTNYAIVSACSTGAHCIGEAFRQIKHGYLDVCIAGGSEASVDDLAIAGFNNMGALSNGKDPDRISIPFDKERDGFVVAEGAGVVVLEELEHALARGAQIYGEVVGYGATADAYHITSPDPEGKGAAKSMELAMAEAGITPAQVDYINAHGTSTPLNDKYETIAIKNAFGEAAKTIAISSTKGATGHLLGAAGAVEAIAVAMALQEGILPPTAGFKEADPDCDLDYVTEGARAGNYTYALSNSLAFGGHNATLCLKKYGGTQ